jgi:methyl-accepting chemotaxis protein
MSIISRLLAGCVILSAVFVATVGQTWRDVSELEELREQADAKTTLLRNHVEADMLHDGARSAYYFALYAARSGNKERRRYAIADAREYADSYRELALANRKLELPRSIRAKVESNNKQMQAFMEGTSAAVSVALDDPAGAERATQDFENRFLALEKENAALSDLYQKSAFQNSERVREELGQVEAMIAITALLVALFGVAFVTYIFRMMIKPVALITQSLVSEDIVLNHDESRSDEIGQLARAVAEFRAAADRVREADQRTAEAEAKARKAREIASEKEQAAAAHERRRALTETAKQLDSDVGEVSTLVGKTTEELRQIATEMSKTAQISQSETALTATAAQQTLDGVQAIVNATDELATSIEEIARGVDIVVDSTQGMRDVTLVSEENMQQLALAAEHVGNVASTIAAIASQTNMLALNATIEAARAGQAGEGFAVVAGEVKALAEQTAKAVGEIDGQIRTMVNATRQVKTSIDGVGAAMEKLDQATTAMATTTQQQSAATQEIGVTIKQAVIGTEIMRANLVNMDQHASATAANARMVLDGSQALAAQVDNLGARISTFIEQTRQAA